jgi:CBS domain containing-hemolysin-like protein
VRRDDGSWLLDGMMGVDEAERLLERKNMRGDEDFETLAGFVLARLGQIRKPATISPGTGCALRSSTWTAAASTACLWRRNRTAPA